IAYNIYARWDYYGVIVLRTGLYAVIIGLIGWFLTRPPTNDAARLYGMLLFGFYVVFLLRRWAVVRPHMFTYTLTVAFLCILESRPTSRWRLCLPLLGLLWANVHGVFYPVMLVIAFAYLAEIGWNWWRAQDPIASRELRGAVPILMTIGTVFLTPLGWQML